MSSGSDEIALRLGTGFAAVVRAFLPSVTEAVHRTGREVSFGATVKVSVHKGLVIGKMVPKEPKIPTEPMEPIPFILQPDASGQLEFLFAGTLEELEREARRGEEVSDPDYRPENNARRASDLE